MIQPSKEIVDQSYVKDYEKLYAEVKEHPEAFWENIAHELSWFKPWNKVLEWNFPYARWFVGAQCNIVNNALDRHQKTATKDKLAYIWVGQDMSERKYTYGQLNEEVCRFANVLKSLGIKKGDKVSIYLPRILEQFITMLACAKIGAVHSVVFSGFSADALKNRILDAEAKLVITTNAYPYKDKVLESKKSVDEAIKDIPTIEHVIVIKRISEERAKIPVSNDLGGAQVTSTPTEMRNTVSSFQTDMKVGRDLWYHELMAKADTICSTEIMESNDPLFILYTSGSTGKPKGVLHGHGGYMLGTYLTQKYVFNLQPDDIYFCTADAGWITGHSYIVYGPLINGTTTFVYEGTPDFPNTGIWWELVQKYKITKFYTAPTAVRALMRLGDEIPNKFDLSSLKILGSVGEPINPEAWLWYYKTIGKEKCPIMDTWWQTETGMHILTPLPSVPLKPGSCFKPFPGVEADVVDENGNSLQIESTSTKTSQDGTSAVSSYAKASEDKEEKDGLDHRSFSEGGKTAEVKMTKQGYLVIKKPWPSMFLDVYNNPKKYKEAYFAKIPTTKSQETNKSPIPNINNDSGVVAKTPPQNDVILASDEGARPESISDFLYFTGDSAKKDEDGYYWIIGRNDDVIKVSGHRLGSAELESAFVAHPSVAEAAVIGKPDEIKGEKIKAFIILKIGMVPTDDLKKELALHVRKLIGPIATPDEIDFVEKLPKTRSGKIMRRVLKAQELGQPLGDTSTLEN